nr:hypothetical protein [Neobacillus sp. Marseille-Q6967]
MKIHDYYRDRANLNLNGSMAALFPPAIIVCVNLFIFQIDRIMLLTIPFLIYSFIGYQFYLHRRKQSILIEKNLPIVNHLPSSLFDAGNLIVVHMNIRYAKLLLFFPNGQMAGMIKEYESKGHNRMFRPKLFALYNHEGEAVGFYKVKGNKIGIFNLQRKYIGCLERQKHSFFKNKKELFNAEGRFIGAVEGASYYMDEQVYNQTFEQEVRLRRGWMPVHWSNLFPEPNTPVLSLAKELSEEDKLIKMSFLINEYFIER